MIEIKYLLDVLDFDRVVAYNSAMYDRHTDLIRIQIHQRTQYKCNSKHYLNHKDID